MGCMHLSLVIMHPSHLQHAIKRFIQPYYHAMLLFLRLNNMILFSKCHMSMHCAVQKVDINWKWKK